MASIGHGHRSKGSQQHTSRYFLLMVVAALVAGTCGSPQPSPSTSSASGDPNASASPTPSTAPAGAWADVQLPPLEPVATLTPTKAGEAGAATDTAFRLVSLDSTPAKTLAASLEVQPAIDLTTAVGADGVVTLDPAKQLAAGTTYRFALRRADGTVRQSWAVNTAKTLQVVGTLPADETSGVPLTTGIEIVFDQLGVTANDIEDAFTISPKVPGSFEVHGKVIAFVPDKPLAWTTVYTITVERGLPLPGTGQVLERDVTFQFETENADPDDAADLVLSTRLVDSSTADEPVMQIDFSSPENGDESFKIPTKLPLTVHRLPNLTTATTAFELLDAAPEWAFTGRAPIDTDDLTLTLKATVPVHRFGPEEEGSQSWIALPETLPAGWYVVTMSNDGRPRQLLLQVTDLAVYAVVSATRTVAWVNDLDDGTPVSGAEVIVAGSAIGRTDADGLREAATPASATVVTEIPRPRFIVVQDRDGRAVFVPMASQQICGKCSSGTSDAVGEGDAWWHVMVADRTLLRQTDRANIWGIVRARDDGSVPDRVEVRLQAYDDWTGNAVPIVTTRATPSSTGMFTAALSFEDADVGDYDIILVADGANLGSSFVHIGPIVKPAWQLDVTTDKGAVLDGSPVKATTVATFFEGTPVAGVELSVTSEDLDNEGESAGPTVTTGSDGQVVSTVTMRLPTDDEEQSQWDWRSVFVRPILPEEADITGEAWVAVFRSTALLDADARLKGTTLTVTGAVHDVDFARMAAADRFSDGTDPRGDVRPGAKVSLDITEWISTRKQIGTAYDFITKRTEPVYEYGRRSEDVGSRSVTTDADGTFRTTFTVTGGKRDYEVVARYTDEGGRSIIASAGAAADMPIDPLARPLLVVPGLPWGDTVSYDIGDEVRVAMRGGAADADRDRYLFTVAHRGLQRAVVQPGPTFTATFRDAWVPNAEIRGVRFNGSAYEPAEQVFAANLRTDDRALTVTVTPDSSRYEPGDTARVSILTRDAADEPVAASVVVRAIDEKLYAIGAAQDTDVLEALYQAVSGAVLAVTWSHQVPTDGYGDGGDTTGGGGDERDDFRDWLLFEQVQTNASGRATVSFKLSDDLTSWRVTASALDRSYRAGSGSANVPVGLPFFVESAVATEYLVGDVPILRMRGFGSALRSGDAVTFVVSAPTLGLAPQTVTAAAFAAGSVTLPALSVGDHRVRIAASTGTGSSRHEDVVIRTIHVVSSRALQTRTASGPLEPGYTLQGGATGRTTVILSDGGRGRAIPILLEFTGSETGRADQALAASLAQAALVDVLGIPASSARVAVVDVSAFQTPDGGIALLPYASPDLELSALAAFADDPAIDHDQLRNYLQVIDEELEGDTTRERRIVRLAGLAAAGQPVLAEIRAAASAADLTSIEGAWLAAGAMAAGDEDLAGRLERAVLAEDGERLGPWVRVYVENLETTATTTAVLAIAAAGIGDPVAADLDAYLEANPPKDTLLDLQRAIAARSWAVRTPGQPAVASLRVDGATRRLEIRPEEPTWLVLSSAQLASATLTPVSGSVLVTTSWEAPLDPSSLDGSAVTTFRRTTSSLGSGEIDGLTFAADDVVYVEFNVVLGPDADQGCWRVTDLVPSGLAPIAERPSWWEEDEEGGALDEADGPWRIEGQRVDFCVQVDPQVDLHHLRYLARVVTPGTYRWEPAVIQSSIVPEHGRTLPAVEIVIRDEG